MKILSDVLLRHYNGVSMEDIKVYVDVCGDLYNIDCLYTDTGTDINIMLADEVKDNKEDTVTILDFCILYSINRGIEYNTTLEVREDYASGDVVDVTWDIHNHRLILKVNYMID